MIIWYFVFAGVNCVYVNVNADIYVFVNMCVIRFSESNVYITCIFMSTYMYNTMSVLMRYVCTNPNIKLCLEHNMCTDVCVYASMSTWMNVCAACACNCVHINLFCAWVSNVHVCLNIVVCIKVLWYRMHIMSTQASKSEMRKIKEEHQFVWVRMMHVHTHAKALINVYMRVC